MLPHGRCQLTARRAPPATNASHFERAHRRALRSIFHAAPQPDHMNTTSHPQRPRPDLGVATRGSALHAAASRLFAVCQATALAVAVSLAQVDTASAILANPNAKMPRSVDAALRRSIPAQNQEIAKVQKYLEDIAYLMRIPQRKPWGSMATNVESALSQFDARAALFQGTPATAAEQGNVLLDQLYDRLKQLQTAVGSQQPETVSVRVASALESVAQLELLQAPGLAFVLPKEYANLPHLTGRAVVRLQFERKDGANTFVKSEGGGTTSVRDVDITLDGYSAPVTAGNFLMNIEAGLYNGRPVNATYTSVLVAGDVREPRPPIPLEILPAGEFDPVYRLPLDIPGGELPELPLSVPGAVAMAHVPNTDSYVSGDEFFIGKFTPQQAGLAGLAFDEGAFGIFGYVTKGMDTIEHLKGGDIIKKAVIVSGRDRLVKPTQAATPAAAAPEVPTLPPALTALE